MKKTFLGFVIPSMILICFIVSFTLVSCKDETKDKLEESNEAVSTDVKDVIDSTKVKMEAKIDSVKEKTKAEIDSAKLKSAKKLEEAAKKLKEAVKK